MDKVGRVIQRIFEDCEADKCSAAKFEVDKCRAEKVEVDKTVEREVVEDSVRMPKLKQERSLSLSCLSESVQPKV